MLRLRAPLSLVAVFVLIALVVGIFIGGRLVQDWNAFHNATPAGDAYRAELAQLEARPLHLSRLQASDPCPDGPEANGLYGAGPVYGVPGWPRPTTTVERNGNFPTAWGTYFYQTYVTDAGRSGLVLVRAWDLRSDRPLIFIGNYAAGPLSGTDQVGGKSAEQHLEVVLDMSHPPSGVASARQLEWPVIVGLANGRSDCLAWQADGPDFTENWVVYALP